MGVALLIKLIVVQVVIPQRPHHPGQQHTLLR